MKKITIYNDEVGIKEIAEIITKYNLICEVMLDLSKLNITSENALREIWNTIHAKVKD